jgi:hypothetical protein
VFDLLNLLFNAGSVAGKALGITLFTLADVSLPPQLGQVAPLEMSSAAYVTIRVRPKTEEERCRYSGIVTPYEQLWEERVTSFGIDSVTPPQPGKIAAYALIINRKDCEGRPPEAMFRVATHRRTLFNGDVLGEGAQYVVLELGQLPEAGRPKWVPQVLERLTQAASNNPVAAEFLRFTEAGARAAAEAGKLAGKSAGMPTGKPAEPDALGSGASAGTATADPAR